MITRLQTRKMANPVSVSGAVRVAHKTMPLSKNAVWASVFILFLLLGFWRTAMAQPAVTDRLQLYSPTNVNQDLKNRNEQLENRLANLEQKFNAICNLPCIQNNPAPNGNGFGQTGTLGAPPALQQNEPNPFTEQTVIRYFLPEGAVNAKIEVRNTENKVVGSFPISQAGYGNITILSGTLSAGTYTYSLVINNNIVDTKKMILLN